MWTLKAAIRLPYYPQSPCYSEEVLVEERGPSVARRAVPASSGAPGERGSLAEIDAPDSPACRLVGKVNTCPLSFDSNLRSDGALSGSGASRPFLAVFSAARLLRVEIVMNVFELTRALVDIDSVTPNEEQVGEYLFDYLSQIAARTGGHVERMEVEPHRFNVLAHWGDPVVTLSTHMDTVPPFFPSREDDEFIWGRGACDTKGIIASMILRRGGAAGGRRARRWRCCSWSARSATARARYAAAQASARQPLPDQRRADREQAGARIEGRAAVRNRRAGPHGALGVSASGRIGDREIAGCAGAGAPHAAADDPMLGASTLNIGTIQGGRAPNVIPDHAQAEVFIRLVDDGDATRAAMHEAVDGIGRSARGPVHPGGAPGLAAGLRDHGGLLHHRHSRVRRRLGQAVSARAGHHSRRAHRSKSAFPKRRLLEAIEIYQNIARQLLTAMNERIPVGILGATGMVGQEFVQFSAAIIRGSI